jgi:hypothetical protein
MKKTLIAVAVLFTMSIAPSIANAALSFASGSNGILTENFNNIAGLPDIVANGTNFVKLGELDNSAGNPGTITFTYLGNESGFTNGLNLLINGTMLRESNAVGTSINAPLGSSSGPVNFEFLEVSGGNDRAAVNGGTWDPGTSIGLIGTNMNVTSGGAAGTYAFILGFNDSGCVVWGSSLCSNPNLNDWDDFVVGVNFVSTIPEPEIYAMMGIGLVLMGFVARRRKGQIAA